jgi:hypothetical protein
MESGKSIPKRPANHGRLPFQNGSNRLLGMVPGRNDLRYNAAALCRHEAGHHVVARLSSFRVGSIRLQVDLFGGRRSGHSEVILASAVKCMAEVGNYLEKRVKILYAGAAAEALKGKRVDQTSAIEILHNAGGESDWARARDCVQLLRNIRSPQTTTNDEIQHQLDELDQMLWSETVEMVERCAEVIGRLAAMMESKITPNQPITISEEEIEAVEGVKELGQG